MKYPDETVYKKQMMIRKRIQFLSVVAATLFLLAGSTPAAMAAEERPAIGALLPLTGKQSVLGNRTLDGIIAGLGLFDKRASVPIELHVENYGSDPAAVSRAVTKLADEIGRAHV